jgi:hypothetical protein
MGEVEMRVDKNSRRKLLGSRTARLGRVGASRRTASATRLITALALALALVASASAAQAAQPPGNDDIDSATRITAVPSTFVANTEAATADRGDGRCVFGHSVWYRYRPTADRRVWLTTLGSDFDTVLAVFTGTRANRKLIHCNDDQLGLASAVRFKATAATTYWIAVSSCCSSRGPGGALRLNVLKPPPPPEAEVSVISAAAGGISGRLVLEGTATCRSASMLTVEFEARQRDDTAVARGSGGIYQVPCWSDTETPWRLRLDSETGWAFQAGNPVLVEGFVFNSDGFRDTESTFETTVTPVDDPAG